MPRRPHYAKLFSQLEMSGNPTDNVTGDLGWASGIFLAFKAWINSYTGISNVEILQGYYCLRFYAFLLCFNACLMSSMFCFVFFVLFSYVVSHRVFSHNTQTLRLWLSLPPILFVFFSE